MGPLSAISIDNDLSPRKAGIPVRATNHKLAGRIDVKANTRAKQLLNACRKSLFYTRDNNIDDVVFYLPKHCAILTKIVVLR